MSDTSTTLPELWVVFSSRYRWLFDSRSEATEWAAQTQEQEPEIGSVSVARYELAAGAHRPPPLPLAGIWLDSEGVAVMISSTARQVRERFALLPDFPVPAKIAGVGTPRWNAAEIDQWMKKQRGAIKRRRH